MALLAALALTCATNAQALDLVGDYQKALTYDPTYQTALAEFQANQASATQALVSYLPEANLSNQRLDTDTTTRQTVRVTQPLIDLGRFATLRAVLAHYADARPAHLRVPPPAATSAAGSKE